MTLTAPHSFQPAGKRLGWNFTQKKSPRFQAPELCKPFCKPAFQSHTFSTIQPEIDCKAATKKNFAAKMFSRSSWEKKHISKKFELLIDGHCLCCITELSNHLCTRLNVDEPLLLGDSRALSPVQTIVQVDGRCALRADYVTFSAFVASGGIISGRAGRIVTPCRRGGGSRPEPLWLSATIANAPQRTLSTSILKRKRERGGRRNSDGGGVGNK